MARPPIFPSLRSGKSRYLRTNIRLPIVIEERIKADESQKVLKFAEMTRSVVSSFIASGTQSLPSRTLTSRLDSKMSAKTFSVVTSRGEMKHWKTVAKAHGHKDRLMPLIASAWAAYFGLLNPGTPSS